MNNTNFLHKFLCVVWLVLLTSTVTASQLIVFESNVSEYTIGSTVDINENIKLKSGQKLELIAPNGTIVKLNGPHNKPAFSDAKNKSKGIAKALQLLLTTDNINTKDMGVTRDSTDVIRSAEKFGWVPEAWVVDINRDGDYCVKEDELIRLWRTDTQSGTLKLTMDNYFEAQKNILENESYISVPQEMPVVDGGKYQFSIDKHQVNTTIHVVPKTVTSVPVTAAWMRKVGCIAQAIAMLRDYQ